MKLPSLLVNAVSTWDGKALAKGQNQIGGFEKSVKNLAKTFGATFGAAAMLSYGKNAVKAFAENEKSAKRLETVLKNIGLGFETTGIEKNLDEISAKFGLQGEVLRDAFQSLITVTGSATKSQDLLNLSLDVAVGSGEDLLTVNKDLAALYVGNTRGLRKYNLGLTQSELKTLKFNDAIALLTKNFAGAATAELDTYSGKMRVLREAADNAQETIGGALIDAFMKLAGDTTVDDLTDSVENLADAMSDIIELGAAFASPFVKVAKLFGDASDTYVKGLYKITGAAYFGKVSDRQYGGAAADKYKAIQEKANAKARAAAEAAAAKREKERLALLKKQELAEKNKLALSKAAAEFDTNRISIAAALKNTYDKETRLRLEALMAIEDEDGDKALDRLKQLNILTTANQTAKLNGLKGITETELAGLNKTLMAELSAIEAAKNAKLAAIEKSGADQASKDAAKLKAIADAEAAEAAAFAKYNDAIAKQGGLDDLDFYTKKTQITTLEVMRLASISKTSAAQTLADQIALAAGLKTVEEIAAKRKAAQEADDKAMADAAAAKKAAEDKATEDYFANLKSKTDAFLAANDQAIAGVAKLSAAIASIPAYPTWTPPPPGKMPGLPFVDGEGNFPDLGTDLGDLFDPGLKNPGGNGNSYTVTVNAGAIASQDEFTALLQDTIQRLNRNGDPLTTAGIA
jgi:hypothetical protein